MNGFIKAILPVEDVAEINIETLETPRIVVAGKYLPGPIRSLERLIVLTEQDQRLDGTAQSSRGLFLVLHEVVQFDGFFVVFDGGTVVSAGVKGVGLCPQAESQTFFVAQFRPDQDGGFREVHGLARVDANPLDNQLSEALDNFVAKQCSMASEKLEASRLSFELR